MKTKLIRLACYLTALLALATVARAQGTAFTYQGRLMENGAPATGATDFTFTLYDAASGGATVGVSNVVNDLAVSNGLVTAALDFGAVAFDGNARWLQIAVRPGAGAGAYTNLAPRLPVTATPYALRAWNAGSATTATSVAAGAVNNTAMALNAVTAANIADGTITSVDLSTSLLNSTFWNLGGNAGITPGNQFFGTTDNQPLELKVNNQRGLRLEPTGYTDTVNVIGGSARNSVAAGVGGATIGGGGAGNYGGNAYTNRVEADFGTVSGGVFNTIRVDSQLATIGGGFQNTIHPGAIYATIGGGFQNSILTNAARATIGGGDQNSAGGNYATVPGGVGNTAGGQFSFAAGHDAKALHDGTFVWADSPAGGFSSSSNNQFLIRAAGGVGINKNNPATALDVNGAVTAASFSGNGAGLTSLSAANLSGSVPSAALTSIPAGNLTGTIADARHSANVPLLGANQTFTGNNTIGPAVSLSFGSQTRQMLNLYGTGYGLGVQASSLYFRCDSAAGTDGFIWYKGGVHDNGYAQPGAGGTELMHLVQGALYVNGALVPSSDRNAKENFAPVQPRTVLEKVVALPLSSWNYKADSTTRHLGPMAQDFYAAFNVGPDDKHIATVDADGVALAAIQGLNQKVEDRGQRTEVRIQSLETENTELKRELGELKQLIQKLAAQQDGGAQ